MSKENNSANPPAQAADEVEADLKNATTKALKALEFWNEPTNHLVTIRDYLIEAARKDRVGSDAIFAKFLYEECAPVLTKRLAKERSVDDNVSTWLNFNCSLVVFDGRL